MCANNLQTSCSWRIATNCHALTKFCRKRYVHEGLLFFFNISWGTLGAIVQLHSVLLLPFQSLLTSFTCSSACFTLCLVQVLKRYCDLHLSVRLWLFRLNTVKYTAMFSFSFSQDVWSQIVIYMSMISANLSEVTRRNGIQPLPLQSSLMDYWIRYSRQEKKWVNCYMYHVVSISLLPSPIMYGFMMSLFANNT